MLLRFRSRKPARPASPLQFRPRLDPLEPRDVPATCYWVGGWEPDPFNATQPFNWENNDVPNQGDTVVFDGDITDLDCENLYVYEGEYAAIHMVDGYDGTVTLSTDPLDQYSSPASIDELVIESGSLNPWEDTYLDVTVNCSFIWTGGTV